ncbi:MAG: histidinol-phosphate transaminase [Lentisphaerae bacterium]|nr:histidinol-phosphate transaminase [Lentisphaerota bacterium]
MKQIANAWIADLPMYEPGKPIEEVARELEFESLADIVKLASNENALSPSPLAVRAMKRAERQMHRYPDSSAHRLRLALARKLSVKPEQLLITNGSNEAIELIGHVFLCPGVDLVISECAFAIFRLIGELFRARVISVPMKDFRHDLDAMLAAITPQTRVVFIANPNNPTGTMVSGAELDLFIQQAPPHVVVVLDEAYIELLSEDQQPDVLKHVRAGRKVIILRTFSKTYGLAGLRIGYAVAPEEGVQLLQRVRQPFNVNAMALAAAEAALNDEAFLRKTRRLVRSGLKFFAEHLTRLGIAYVPAVTNFMLVETGQARATFQALQKEKIIVRPMDGYGLPDHVRITIGTLSENQRCLQALARVLNKPEPQFGESGN